LANLACKRLSNAVHLGVMLPTDLIEDSQPIVFDLAAPIEPPLELGELEVAIDRVRICSQ